MITWNIHEAGVDSRQSVETHFEEGAPRTRTGGVAFQTQSGIPHLRPKQIGLTCILCFVNLSQNAVTTNMKFDFHYSVKSLGGGLAINPPTFPA